MTILVVPNEDKPAVNANGTVRPSERPSIASEMIRALTWKFSLGILILLRSGFWTEHSRGSLDEPLGVSKAAASLLVEMEGLCALKASSIAIWH